MKSLIAAAALSLIAGSARAQDPAADAMSEARTDLRCVVAFGWLAKSDPKMKEGAMLGAFYYLGRVDSRHPELDLKKALGDAAQGLVPQDLVADAKRCGATVKARGEALKAVGASR